MEQELFKAYFDFGVGECADGYIKVGADDVYSEEKGYGFVFDTDNDGNRLAKICAADRGGEILKRDFCYADTTDVPLRFDIDVPHNGAYNIKVIMGDYAEENTVTLQTESRRFMINGKKIRAGEFIEEEFTVSVCDVHRKDEERFYNRKLNIAVMGDKACINAVSVEEVTDAITIYVAGDSTVTDQTANYPYNPKSTYCGWGQMLGQYLKKGVCVSNHAQSGLTTQTFMGIHWAVVKERIKAGDFLFIQFGHNDQKVESLGAFTGYYENLKYYINYARSVGATPVVCTPINRIIFENDGTLRDLLGEYGSAVRSICKEMNVVCIDLLKKTTEYFTGKGDVESWDFFWGDGVNRDYTHTNDFGGDLISKFVAQGIADNKIEPICEFVRTDLIAVEMPKIKVHTKRSDDNSKELKALSNIGLVNVPKFVDINGAENEDKIRELSSRGILDSVRENEFAADELLTAESAVKWAAAAAGIKCDEAKKVVSENGWLINADDAPITREKLAVLVINSYNHRAPDRAIVGSIEQYSDRNLIDDSVLDFVRAANELGVLRGVSETEYAPKSTLTRGEAVEIFYRLIKTN